MNPGFCFLRFTTRKVRGRLYEIELTEAWNRHALTAWRNFRESVPGGKLYVLRDKPCKRDMGQTFSKLEIKL